MTIKDFTKGRKVLLVDIMHNLTHSCTVSSVGRKYVICVDRPHLRFYLRHPEDTYLVEESVYSPDYRLYLSEEDYRNTLELQMLQKRIMGAFQITNIERYTLDQLRRINRIIEEKNSRLEISLIENIADWIIKESVRNTTEGNWITYADEIQRRYGLSDADMVGITYEIMEALEGRPDVLDVIADDTRIDVVVGTESE